MEILIKNFKKYWPFLVICIVTIFTFWPFFFQGKIPVAGDILLGQYYPWLDTKWENRSTIYPVLNSTIPDSIFSFYPWKLKSIESLKQGMLPTYDPNTYMGHQLFASGTTGILYPLNFIFFLTNFNIGWGILVSATPLLSALFFYIWLRNKGLEKIPILIISIAYAFSAFIALQVSFINTSHSVLWLPLILFSIDKILERIQIRYFILLIFSLYASLNAGFFQGSLYITAAAFLYGLYFCLISKKNKKFLLIVAAFIFPVILSAFQILPFVEVVGESNRISNYGATGQSSEIFEFFVPLQFLITTFFPDFFGNPGKANYFGGANSKAWVGYFEFNNFSGTLVILGLIPGLMLLKKQKEILFFSALLIFTLILSTSNPIAAFPYNISLPIFSSLVPSRMLVLTQFSLLVMAVYGLNLIFRKEIRLKQFLLVLGSIIIFYSSVVVITYLQKNNFISLFGDKNFNWQVSFRNTILPTIYLLIFGGVLAVYLKFKIRALWFLALLLSCFELIRQTSYFRPFINPDLIYPKTPAITFLEQNLNGYRMMINKQDLIPTNSQLVYNLKIVDGEGPIYPKNHGGFIGSINSPDFSDKLSTYRRMIYFRNTDTNLLGLLNIKYIVSSSELNDPNLELVFEEGSTKIYENLNLLNRAWSVESVVPETDQVRTMKALVSNNFDPQKTAVVQNSENKTFTKVNIENFTQNNNQINFNSNSEGESLIVISEQFYPGWRLFIDNLESKPFPADFNLIGLNVPEGNHEIKLIYEMSSLKYGTYISLASIAGLILFVIFMKYKKASW